MLLFSHSKKKNKHLDTGRGGWKSTSQSSRWIKLELVHANMLAYKEFTIPDFLVSNKWVTRTEYPECFPNSPLTARARSIICELPSMFDPTPPELSVITVLYQLSSFAQLHIKITCCFIFFCRLFWLLICLFSLIFLLLLFCIFFHK